MDSNHAMCTYRKFRAGQAAPKLERLHAAAASARKVVQALQGARDAVEAQLEQWQARLQQIQEAEKQLWAAADEGRDAGDFPVPAGLELLVQDAASLLGATWRLKLSAEADRKWKAHLQLAASGRSALVPLLLQLHQEGSLDKVGCC